MGREGRTRPLPFLTKVISIPILHAPDSAGGGKRKGRIEKQTTQSSIHGWLIGILVHKLRPATWRQTLCEIRDGL